MDEEFGQIKNERELEENSNLDKRVKNVIFVGVKPFMTYVTGVVMQFQNKNKDSVSVSARGKFISKAVDVVEVARRTFLKDEHVTVKEVIISSEQFKNENGREVFVSAVDIILSKNDKVV